MTSKDSLGYDLLLNALSYLSETKLNPIELAIPIASVPGNEVALPVLNLAA